MDQWSLPVSFMPYSNNSDNLKFLIAAGKSIASENNNIANMLQDRPWLIKPITSKVGPLQAIALLAQQEIAYKLMIIMIIGSFQILFEQSQ